MAVVAFLSRPLRHSRRVASPVFVVFTAIAILSIVPSVRASKPNSPKAAIQGFFGLIQAQRFSAAYERVVRCDRDDFPARPNDVQALGDTAGIAVHLDEHSFADYWRTLLCTNPAPWLEIRTHDFRECKLGQRLFGVEFQLEFIIRSKKWLWLSLVGVVPGFALALILSYMTSTRVRGRLHKLVYCMDGEFQLFNGEFQGAEEFDLQWLQNAEMPGVHARYSKSSEASG